MNANTALPRVGFIGLGAMGAPMAGHLHRAGLLTGVWARNPASIDALLSTVPVPVAGSPAELAAGCEVIVLCVSADRDVLALVDVLAPALAAGSLVIDTSTVAPVTAQQAAGRLAAIGVDFVDAPLTGGVEGARNGTLSVLVGADEAVFARARPVLDCFARSVVRFGPVGAGQAAKAVNQVMVAGIAEAVCEALALAEHLGLDGDALVDALGGGAAGSWFLDKRGHSLLAGRFDVGFKLRLLAKDLDIVAAMADAQGLRLPGVEAARADYAALLDEDRGDHDISALIDRKRRQLRKSPSG